MADKKREEVVGSRFNREEVRVLEGLRGALGNVDERNRSRLLAAILTELAEDESTGGSGSASPVEELNSRVVTLSEEKAHLEDAIASLRTNLDHRSAKLKAEEDRAAKLEELCDEQRMRLRSLQQSLRDAESQAGARAKELHNVEVELDDLRLTAQRNHAADDQSDRIARLVSERQAAQQELEKERTDFSEYHSLKETEIRGLQDELAKAKGESTVASVTLAELWPRLAVAEPALVDRREPPSPQTGERLMDSLHALADTVDKLDNWMRPFMTKATNWDPQIKPYWQAYHAGSGVLPSVRQTLAPRGGKPVQVLGTQLRTFRAWLQACIVAGDATVESVASELTAFVRGANGTGDLSQQTIREFLRSDNADLFQEQLCMKRAKLIAQAFATGK